MDFINGHERILYIKEDSIWHPVACLTSNPFSEEVDMMQTTTRESNGWETSRPVSQRYSITFEGLQILTANDTGDTSKMSYDRLKVIKRNRQKIEWKIEDSNSMFLDEGYGYIKDIGEGNEVGEFLTFSGSIVGYGEPVFTSGDAGAYIFQDGETFLFQDGTGFLFN